MGINPNDLNGLVLQLEALKRLAKPVTPGGGPPVGANLRERVEALEARVAVVESDVAPLSSTLDLVVGILLSLISSLNNLIVVLLELQEISTTLRDLVIPAVEDRVTEVEQVTHNADRMIASGDWLEGHKNG